ncbi:MULTISPECIES: ribosome hibernation-promoting factor, HPF/YfiA family [Paenibacillus]|uniref:Ribosome hibernation promoting factor n=1 Tax=Paenibacillus radicis (ex Xue et al. 2023) TaxID=2972489 RepID=A0ABT1YTG3_9BACL|nr:ribosome-associated translation inhibitor RaiA [Paenibacillus radicis (ex Xue et al. 2023)]MCR8636473.1 ribosome-associated translation inhibitor RaiA [Paenibacillus radicis (ex Xue et al. 2023)]
MRQILHGKNMEITPVLGDYAKRKLGKPDDMYDVEGDMHITLSVQGHKHEHTVEVTIRFYGMTLRVEEKQDDMYAAIDLAADKLERRMRKLKEKVQGRLRKSGLEIPELANIAEAEQAEVEDFAVVRRKNVLLKPVDVQEAILNMKLLDHDFHLFHNRETNLTELVYKRHDGSFGHIAQA